MGRNMLGKAFEAFPDQGTLEALTSSTLKWPGDNRYWPGRISRPRYRPTSGQGESFIPTEYARIDRRRPDTG